jgi:ribosomal-protein-alanine N-acetyltransferase
MELRGPRVTLRPPRPEDAAELFPYASDPEISGFMYWGPHATPEETAAYLEGLATKEAMFVIEVEGKAAGVTGMTVDWENRLGETETWIGRPYWGLGLNTEAKVVLFDFMFGPPELKRIQSLTHVQNVRSQRALEKLGFKREGLLRRYRWIRGEPWDVYMYSLLPEEWLSIRPPIHY